ncbi:hypothetical protein RRG08_000498 [Elysia crispata]|uniref:Uncharacterized protein n=1 Tax=Elysia crispata TaxID=231223 RepID=A0AAE0YDS5_9GAST|nr:hypothetical protein RRG08_000498 [Elysia crispata]
MTDGRTYPASQMHGLQGNMEGTEIRGDNIFKTSASAAWRMGRARLLLLPSLRGLSSFSKSDPTRCQLFLRPRGLFATSRADDFTLGKIRYFGSPVIGILDYSSSIA